MSLSPGFPLTRYSPELIEACFQIYAKGQSLAEIAASRKIPYDTLRGWSSRYKWKLRLDVLTGRLNGTQSENSLPVEQSQRDRSSKMTFDEKQNEVHTRLATEALRFVAAIESMPTTALVQHADKIAKLATEARKALSLEEHRPQVVVNVGLLHDLSERRRAKLLAKQNGTPLTGALELVEGKTVVNDPAISDSSQARSVDRRRVSPAGAFLNYITALR
jgi:hypothetical protein